MLGFVPVRASPVALSLVAAPPIERLPAVRLRVKAVPAVTVTVTVVEVEVTAAEMPVVEIAVGAEPARGRAGGSLHPGGSRGIISRGIREVNAVEPFC